MVDSAFAAEDLVYARFSVVHGSMSNVCFGWALKTSNQTSRSDAHSLQAIDIAWWAHQGSNLGPAD
ncbi:MULTISPECIES: hypothetical protein [Bradyrhizobium]|uniref:hypothetical protein n=1 Tax=Bradyrhizobium TaxID=374 RepID=UPI0012BBA715|nr:MULTISPECIES: hypothetical protein [Bradyrhizobium]WLB91016.1 hypothetical protein QIH91_11610 [Bradyrhizobium japonicum USDA 135]